MGIALLDGILERAGDLSRMRRKGPQAGLRHRPWLPVVRHRADREGRARIDSRAADEASGWGEGRWALRASGRPRLRLGGLTERKLPPHRLLGCDEPLNPRLISAGIGGPKSFGANRRRLPRSAFSFGASPSANPVSDRREDASRLDPFRDGNRIRAVTESPATRFSPVPVPCRVSRHRLVRRRPRLAVRHAGQRGAIRTQALLRLHSRLRHRVRQHPERQLQAPQEGRGALGPLWRLLVVHRKDQGHLPWRSTDRFFAAAACSGLVALPMFIGSPGWASGRSSTIAPPLQTHLPEFQAMIRRVIARYGAGGSYWKKRHRCLGGKGRVPKRPSRIWQVWNEPNVMGYYGGQKATAEGYGRLLTAADKAINTSINPRAKTVLGGLTGSRCNRLPEGSLQGGAPPQLTRQRIRPARLRDHSSELPRPLEEVPSHRQRPRRQAQADLGQRGRLVELLAEGPFVSGEVSQQPPGQGRGRSAPLPDSNVQPASSKTPERCGCGGSPGIPGKIPSLSRATCDFCYGSGLLHRGGRHKPAWSAYVNLARGRR